MLTSSNLKLYRQFLILALLLGGLYFALAPGGSTSAKMPGQCEPPDYGFPCCCSVCLERATDCMNNNCTGLTGWPLQLCWAACNNEQTDCRMVCDGLC